jgi:hypothetical protein
MRKLGGVVFSILLVSSMVTPVTAFSQEENLGTAEGMDILQETEELSADQQHALAASLLESYTGSESDSSGELTQATTSEQRRINEEQIENLHPDLPERRERAASTDLLSDATVEQIKEGTDSGDVDKEMFESHARAVSDLADHADRRRDLNVRIDAATSMLVRADRERARESIDDARQTFQAHRSELSPEQRREIRAELRAATQQYHAASTKAETRRSSLGPTTRTRTRAIRQYGSAYSTAEAVSASVTRSAPVEIEITSRGDPVRNGSETTTRTIAGVVTGVQAENVESVTLTVNEERTVDANVSDQDVGAEFKAKLTLEERINVITATVTASPSEESGTTSTGATEDQTRTRPLTRLLPENATTAGSGDADFDIDTSSATTVLDPSMRTVTRSITLESEASASTTTQRVRILESRTATNAYPEPPGTTVAVLDVLAREGTPADDRQSAVVYNTTRSDIRSVYGELPENLDQSVRFYRFNDTAGKWEPVPAVVSERNDGTVTVRTLITTDVTTSLLGLSIAEDGDSVPTPTTTPTPTVADETEPTKTPDSAGGAPEADEDGGVIDSIVSIIRDIIDGILDLFSFNADSDSPRKAGSQAQTLKATESGVEPSIQSQEMATDQLRLDGDGLTDEFEAETLGSNPLDPNSDIPRTGYDESNDTFVDGAHDSDTDSVTNAFEASNSLDPFETDTDGDGLSDGVEARFGRFDGTLVDSNGNGVADGADDPDGDGFTNAQEVDNGTAPFDADTDADSLNDSVELGTHGTDPRKADTDGDGLDDDEEITSLPTDPTDPDTDGDGVRDGNETFTTSTTNESLDATVDITGEGNVADTVTIRNGSNPNIEDTMTVQNASVSSVVDFRSEAEFDSANVTLSYNESAVDDPSTLAVYRRNETTGEYEPLNSSVDPEAGTVTAETEHFSRFVVFRVPNWSSNFEAIEPPNIADEAGLVPVDAAFILDSSGSMSRNDPNDLRLDASKRFVSGLIEGEDRAAVIDFDSNARTLQSLTTDFQSVNSSIDQVDSFGGTDIADGIDEGVSEYQQNSDDSRAKIAVLLTDGIDRQLDPQADAQEAAEENITIYTVGFGTVRESDLKTIAQTTGGNFTKVDSPEELPNVFARIANQTGPQDSDGDGLNDSAELAGFRTPAGERIRTDPFDVDTDGDGTPDGVEAGYVRSVGRTVNVTLANSTGDPVQREYNQTVRVIESDPTDLDSDNDGLTDRQERGTFEVEHTTTAAGTTALEGAVNLVDETDLVGIPPGELSGRIASHTTTREVSTDPNAFHSDGDGIGDGREVTLGTDPTRTDTDDDEMADDYELNLPQEDPTLYDNTRPTIRVHSIDTRAGTVDRGFTPIPGVDREYEVTYDVSDNAGVDYSVLKRGDLGDLSTERTNHFDGRDDRVTATVIADSVVLASAAGIVFGDRVDIEAVDVNGNGAGEFRTQGQPNIWEVFVKNVGDILPNFALLQTPLVAFGLIDGFLSGIAGAVESLLGILIDLAANPFGEFRDAIELVADVALTIMKDAFGFLNGLIGSVRERQQASNPFNPPPALSNPSNGIDGIVQLVTQDVRQAANLDLSVFATSDYTAFGVGFVGGYLLSFVADKIISAAITVLTGGGGAPLLIGSIAAFVTSIQAAKAIRVGRAVSKVAGAASTVLDIVSYVGEISNANDIVDEDATAGLVSGLRELSTVGNLKGAEQFAAALREGERNTGLLDRLLNSVAARELSVFLARTGEDGPETFGVAVGSGFDEANRLLDPAVGGPTANARFQRTLVDARVNGDLSEAAVGDALGTIEAASDPERRILARAVPEAGVEGATFLAEADPSTATALASELESEREAPSVGRTGPITLESELYTLVRQAGGTDTADAVATLGAGTTVDLLKLDSGAAAVARANIVDAVASDSLSASEVDSFIAEIEGASLSTRQRRLNDVAFSANNSETVTAVTAGSGNPSESGESNSSADSRLSSEPSPSVTATTGGSAAVHPQTAVPAANGRKAIIGARIAG